jgi:hypothetical protein
VTTPTSSRSRLVRLAVLLLAGAVLAGVLAPALPAAEPVQPARTAAQDDSGGLSPFAIAGIAFGFAMAGTALAIALWSAIEVLRRRADDEPKALAAPKPFASATPRVQVQREAPAPVSPAPVSPAPVAPSPAASAAAAPTPTLVEARQPSARPVQRPQAEERACTIELWRGYVKCRYYATARDPGGAERTIAASPFFRPERGVPPEESHAGRQAYDTLLEELAALGWAPVEADTPFAFSGRNQST